jgi:hypothetical protein
VDETELRERMRELLASGRIPRELPTASRDAERGQVEPRVHVGLQAAEHCVLCGEAGPEVSYTYPSGRVIRLHAQCNVLWHEERSRLTG